jgi:hypothetical protein
MVGLVIVWRLEFGVYLLVYHTRIVSNLEILTLFLILVCFVGVIITMDETSLNFVHELKTTTMTFLKDSIHSCIAVVVVVVGLSLPKNHRPFYISQNSVRRLTTALI